MRKALFLDRDGIINIDKTYTYRWEDIEWVEGIFDLLSFANTNDFLVIVITNQSGVAQGMYKEEDIKKLHQKMNEFLAQKNLHIDDWFYCTEYNSERRKPRPGMMLEARDKYDIDLSQSIMIGDKLTDIIDVPEGITGAPKTLLLKGNYPLIGAKAEVYGSLKDILFRVKELARELSNN
jgi:D-glycero-D-manno-heptose 1,7-bisphosphate phosphatase